jgi:queuine tRNA-ribosyltransferase
MQSTFQFKIGQKDPHTGARTGLMRTSHGDVQTPLFLPVGTRGAVKGMAPWELEEIGFEMVLANTYHLYLRPGPEIIEAAKGLHSFMAWPRGILTDSGGFQIFSLSKTLKVEEDGVYFRSIYDGSEQLLTPEKAVKVQEALGSDIAMILDHCTPYPSSREEVQQAVITTIDWARRSLASKKHSGQALFGIVQGGVYADLRARSAEETAAMDFPGYGIGGLSVGEPREAMLECLQVQTEILPESKPRHLLGIGDPEGLLRAVAMGVDIFDCVIPTRMARNGVAFTEYGRLNIRHANCASDLRSLDAGCSCPACTGFSRAYIRHLFKANEMLAHRLLTWHNLSFMQGLVLDCRAAIGAGRIVELLREWEGWDKLDPAENDEELPNLGR